MKLEQWVNLAKNPAQEAADPTKPLTLSRLGRDAKIRVKFREDHGAHAKYKVVASEAVHSVYPKGTERKYHAFRLNNGRSSVVTAPGETTVTQSCSLPAMGGNEYKVEAKYKDAAGNETVKTSTTFLTGRRRVFCVPVQMETHRTATAKLDDAFTKLQKSLWDTDELYIDVRKIEPAISSKLARVAAPYGMDPRDFFDKLRPYLKPLKTCIPGFGLAWVDQLATKVTREEDDALFDVAAGTPSGKHGYDATAEEVTLSLKDPLWTGFSDAEDDAKHWLDDVSVITFDDVGADLPPISLPRKAVRIGDPINAQGGPYRSVKIDLKEAPDARQAIYTRTGQFKVVWSLRYATDFGWGVSYGAGNVVAVATRCQWEPLDPADVIATALHEVAHRLGLVPNGTRPPYLEKNPNEDGSRHCKNRQCVMLAEGSAPNKLCHSCYTALRRTDLSLSAGVFGASVT